MLDTLPGGDRMAEVRTFADGASVYPPGMESVVATGVWLYDDAVPTTVRVVMLDYDFWRAVAEADGDVEPDEAPDLDERNVRLYYVRHRPGWPAPNRPFWPDSPGFGTLAEAVDAAEADAPGPIVWQEDEDPLPS